MRSDAHHTLDEIGGAILECGSCGESWTAIHHPRDATHADIHAAVARNSVCRACGSDRILYSERNIR